MKKLFTGGSKKTDRNSDTISDKTIDRIVCKKEEEAAFQGSCCILYTTQTVVFGLQYKVYILLRN